MKALISGIGSIGLRHLRLFRELGIKDFVLVTTKKRDQIPENKNNIVTIGNLDKAIEHCPDFAVIANPTAFHISNAQKLAKAGIPFLIEKPVSDKIEGLSDLKRIVHKKNIPVMVAFQLRQHPFFQKLRQVVESGVIGEPIGLQGHVGQYLPDWRPNDDYTKCYSAKREFGGGVILDLCHEIDIALELFGEVRKVSCISGKFSDLDIDTEDLAEISLIHTNKKISHLHLDYLERGYKWFTRIIGTQGSVIWNYGRKFIEITDTKGSATRWEDAPEIDRDWLFRSQGKHWLGVLEKNIEPSVGLDQGISVCRIAIAAKQSAKEGRHIEL